jgi:hypothetical protein
VADVEPAPVLAEGGSSLVLDSNFLTQDNRGYDISAAAHFAVWPNDISRLEPTTGSRDSGLHHAER